MTETRVCRYVPCSKSFHPTHWRQEFCGDTCRANSHYLDHPEKGRVLRNGALRSVAAHPLDEAREAQALEREKRMWRLAIEVQIGEMLRSTGFFHADDLDQLGIPRQHGQLAGTRTAALSREGLMERTGVDRARANPSANFRKTPIYRVTPKGRRELGKWVDARRVELVGIGGGPLAATADSSERQIARIRSDGSSGGDGPNRALAPVAADSGDTHGSPDQGRDPSATATQAPPAVGGSAAQLFDLNDAREKPRSAITDPRAA